MLKISKKLDYALIILAHLAHAPSEKLSSAGEIAKSYGLPRPVTAGILKTLARHKIARSIRGVNGGYILCVSPDLLKLSEIVEAIEGPFKLADCATHKATDKECEYIHRCPVRDPVRKIHETLVGVLATMTLRDLAATLS